MRNHPVVRLMPIKLVIGVCEVLSALSRRPASEIDRKPQQQTDKEAPQAHCVAVCCIFGITASRQHGRNEQLHGAHIYGLIAEPH